MKCLSTKATSIKPSGIRKFFDLASTMEGVISLGVGEPDFATPWHICENAIHYMSTGHTHYTANRGLLELREEICKFHKEHYNQVYDPENEVIVTIGGSEAIDLCMRALLNPGDEVIVLDPNYVAYAPSVILSDGVVVPLQLKEENDFKILPEDLKKVITPKTKAVIVNTPNNPTGVVYSEDTIKKMAAIMDKKQKEYGTEIYLIADEPYRELAYDGVDVPYLTKYYDNTIVGYSYSKSLSLPGERIGYLVIPDEVTDSEDVKSAASVATRILGFVNAPSLMQRVVAKCVDAQVNLEAYDKNRKAIYEGLTRLGFECVKPEGAFYLFVKSPVEDETVFCEAAKKHNILMVPASSFGCPGYVRIAYCVSYETIVNSLPHFAEVAKEMGL